MVKFKTGDMFEGNHKYMVNPVNCVGVMGGGLALEFKNRFPEMFLDYKKMCDLNLLQVGSPKLIGVTHNDQLTQVVLFPTKDHYRYDSEISYIATGLYGMQELLSRDIDIAFPKLGCGLGGLDWKVVKPIMVDFLTPLKCDATIYE